MKNLIGIQIRKARIERNISQENLAYESNIDRKYMGDIENGKVNISVNKLKDILRTLNISLSDFFKAMKL